MFVFFLPIGMLGLFVMVFLSYNNLSPAVSNSVTPLPKYTPFINKKIDIKPIAEVLNNKNEYGLIHTDKILGKESLKESFKENLKEDASSAKFNGATESKELLPNGHSTAQEYVSTDVSTSTEQKSAHNLEVKDLELLNNNVRDKVTILQLLPIYVFPITYNENIPNPELPIKPFNTSFHFGMLSSLASADFKEISNYFIGMHTNKSISNRWALTGQLGLRTYIKSNFYLQNKAGDNNLETNLSDAFLLRINHLQKVS
ncbi:MAG: hypothetical protein IPO92_18295 [Saprospiraceae bacterium]|nr:hypothetical protein [Saprospiraceae bacterium]